MSCGPTVLFVFGIVELIVGVILVLCGIFACAFNAYEADAGAGFISGAVVLLIGLLAVLGAKRNGNPRTARICHVCIGFVLFFFVFGYAQVAWMASLEKDYYATVDESPEWCFDGCCEDCSTDIVIEFKSSDQRDPFFNGWENSWSDWRATSEYIPCSSSCWRENCKRNDEACVVDLLAMLVTWFAGMLLIVSICVAGALAAGCLADDRNGVEEMSPGFVNGYPAQMWHVEHRQQKILPGPAPLNRNMEPVFPKHNMTIPIEGPSDYIDALNDNDSIPEPVKPEPVASPSQSIMDKPPSAFSAASLRSSHSAGLAEPPNVVPEPEAGPGDDDGE